MIKREKMSSVDTAWLRMDRPTNLMMIVGVLIFEGAVDYERLKSTIASRLAPFRRFRQRVVVDGAGAYWEDDPTYDIDAHLHRVALPGKGDKEDLEKFAADMASQPLDDIGMGVSILSYNGGVQFGLVTDKSFVPDPQNIVGRFFPEFERLLLAVLQCPRDVPLDPVIAERRILAARATRIRSRWQRSSGQAR